MGEVHQLHIRLTDYGACREALDVYNLTSGIEGALMISVLLSRATDMLRDLTDDSTQKPLVVGFRDANYRPVDLETHLALANSTAHRIISEIRGQLNTSADLGPDELNTPDWFVVSG